MTEKGWMAVSVFRLYLLEKKKVQYRMIAKYSNFKAKIFEFVLY